MIIMSTQSLRVPRAEFSDLLEPDGWRLDIVTERRRLDMILVESVEDCVGGSSNL